MTAGLLDAALGYAERGWAVFPCHNPAGGGRCSCGRPDCASAAKHPRTRRGLHDATTDPDVITHWCRRWPNANIAVRTGARSGVVVLDVDPNHGGRAALHELQRRHGPLPQTAEVRTGSGGGHLWFAHPGEPVRNSAGWLGPGLDIRGDGGYVIVPPSRHATGGHYRWASEAAPAQLPESLTALCREPERERVPVRAVGIDLPRDAGSWAAAAFRGELDRLRTPAPGTRNHTLNRAAFSLGQLVAGQHLDEDVVRDALTNAGVEIGLDAREIRATVASGLRAGSRAPRVRGALSNGPPDPTHALGPARRSIGRTAYPEVVCDGR